MESKSLSDPKWDGNPNSCARYIVQFSALAKFYDCGGALDKMQMANCPTKLELFNQQQLMLERLHQESCTKIKRGCVQYYDLTRK